jgi:hypothetical protein
MDQQQLLGLYSTERQDNQTSVVVAFAIVTAALTYIVATTPYFAGHCTGSGCHDIRPWVQMAAPAPLVALLGFLVLNLAGTLRRSGLLLDLEVALRQTLPVTMRPAPRTEHAAKLIYGNVWKHRYGWVYAICSLASYATAAGLVIGDCCVLLMPGEWTWNKQLVALLYAIVISCEVAGLAIPVLRKNFPYDEIW